MNRLLIVDDDAGIRKSIKLSLMGQPFKVMEVGTLDEAYKIIKSNTPDIMLLDVHFQKGETCHKLLSQLKDEELSVPTLILSGVASAKEAVEAINLGAYDFIEKPVNSDRLISSLNRCLESAKMNQTLDSMMKSQHFASNLIGQSPQMQEVKHLISLLAPKPVKILITGETGTGKEVIAKSIWSQSRLKDKAFITVNCAAVPDELMESELFGHKKGSFTGATQNQIGKVEMADGGTLFLDEIGELSLKAQTKLLRFLENDEIQPLGSTVNKRVNVRVLAATSRNLMEEMEKDYFRKDLYYRLNLGRIELPNLRDRCDDIDELFMYFIARGCKKYEINFPQVDKDVMSILKSYSWPGNVRELKNIAERTLLYSSGVIDASSLRTMGINPQVSEQKKRSHFPLGLSLKEFKNLSEKQYIIDTLIQVDGAISDAAIQLEVNRSYLHQKIKQLNIAKSDYI